MADLFKFVELVNDAQLLTKTFLLSFFSHYNIYLDRKGTQCFLFLLLL